LTNYLLTSHLRTKSSVKQQQNNTSVIIIQCYTNGEGSGATTTVSGADAGMGRPGATPLTKS